MPMQRTNPSPSCGSARSPTRNRCIDGFEMRRICPGPVRWKNQSALRGITLVVTRAGFDIAKTSRPCSGSNSVLDQFTHEGPVAARLVHTRAGAEQRDRLTLSHPRSQLLDASAPRFDLGEIARPVLLPGD